MKVLLLATGFPPAIGGTERFAGNLARGLQMAGCSVRVLTTLGISGPEDITDVEVTRTPSFLNRKFLKLLPLCAAAIRLCRRERPDRVVAMVWTHEGFAAVLLRLLFGIDYAVVAHGSEILQYRDRRLHWLAMRSVLRHARLLVANSRFTRALLLESGILPERVVVLNPPIGVVSAASGRSDVNDRYGLAGRLVMFTAARLVPRKGHAHVIEVLGTLKDRYPDLVYVMTGTGPYRRELERLASRLDVADRLVLIGQVSDRDLEGLYQRADIYVSPSIEVDGDVEGFGIALAEAGAHGIPVIAGRSGGVEDIVRDGETGVLVTPGDRDDLTRAIVSLIDDGALRRALGSCAQARILDELRVDRQGARFYGYLADLPGRLKPAPTRTETSECRCQ